MLKICFFTILFMISLYILYALDKDLYRKNKAILIVAFIIINSIFMVSLSFSDNPFLGMVYNGFISVLIILPYILSMFTKKKNLKKLEKA